MTHQRKIVPAYTYLPEQEFRDITIKYKTFTEDEARLENLRLSIQSMGTGVYLAGLCPNQTYTVLRKNGRIWMSDTPMERNSNGRFIQGAHGKVFIGGLGIGLCVMPLLDCPDVKSVEVWEIDQDVIDLFSKHVKHSKLTIKQADILEEIPPTSVKYDSVLLDIWPNICLDNYDEMKTLKRRWGHRLNKENPNAFLDIWSYSVLQYQKRQEYRERYAPYSWY